LVGESVRDSALPWDTIGTTRFRAGEPLENTIESLTASHFERTKEDPNFRYLTQFVEDTRETRSRKSVSLNIDSRRAERETHMERGLELENERRAALSLEPIGVSKTLKKAIDRIFNLTRPPALLQTWPYFEK